MTGPEHYREAENLLDEVPGPDDEFTRAERIAMAQVHATLANAAATATEVGIDEFWDPKWGEVLKS